MNLNPFRRKPEPEPDPVAADQEPVVAPEVLPAEPTPQPPVVKEIPPRPLTDHDLHVKAHHENLQRIRAMDDPEERATAWNKHMADAEDIRAYKRLHFTQDDLRTQFWNLQFQIEDMLTDWEVASAERRAELAGRIDELAKERTHVVYALNRADGSPGGQVGYTGPRPVR